MFNRPKPGILTLASDSESQAREKISILCPTRNRVDDLEKFVTSVYETAEYKDLLEFIFYIDDKDVVGYIDPPYFSADFADLWMNDIAQRIDRKIWIDIDTEHMHPAVGKGKWDSTHKERLQRLHEDDNKGIYKSKEDERITDSNKLLEFINNYQKKKMVFWRIK
jgi:hypothetical protein|tara:strand:- start:28 stop:522 length:495 start_codon:yes stop_codon:yes gene_type:complete